MRAKMRQAGPARRLTTAVPARIMTPCPVPWTARLSSYPATLTSLQAMSRARRILHHIGEKKQKVEKKHCHTNSAEVCGGEEVSNSALSSAGAQTRGAIQLAINQALRAGQAAAMRCTRDYVGIRVRVRQYGAPRAHPTPDMGIFETGSLSQGCNLPWPMPVGKSKVWRTREGRPGYVINQSYKTFLPVASAAGPPGRVCAPPSFLSSSSLQTGRTRSNLVRETSTPKTGLLPLLVGVATADELAVCPAVNPLADHELAIRRLHAYTAVAAVGLALDADLRARARSSPVATRP